MKLLQELNKHVESLKPIKRAWFTTFNLNINFFERHILSTLLQMDKPKSRIDYEVMQQKINGISANSDKNKGSESVDIAIFADQRMHDASDIKSTAINVYSVNPTQLKAPVKWAKDTLFHPKVIYLESADGCAILGSGSANLTLSGWSSNQEVFAFKEIETKTQRKSVKAFFEVLFNDDNLDIAPKLSNKRGATWQFIHSLSGPSFLDCIFPSSLDNDQYELAVWSPYFPQDLASFIQKIEGDFKKKTSDKCSLSLHITPDLFENKQLRTRWSAPLGELISAEKVQFYKKHEEYVQSEHSDLCHAKIWMTDTCLAIGSWNFTAPGSNLYLNDEEREQSNINIEAGIVIEHEDCIADHLGKKLDVSDENFMSDEALKEHALEVSELLPFNIDVSFDWRSLKYKIEISNALDFPQENLYKLQLPDMEDIVLTALFKPYVEEIKKPQQLMSQHTYEIYEDDKLIYRGFIIETNAQLRRVEQFASLNDIFSSLISDVDFGASGDTLLRDELENAEEQTQSVMPETEDRAQSLSYFRIFQAFDEFNIRIDNVADNRELEQYAFVVPGCLEELKEKIESELTLADGSGMNVQNWFMVQELNLLIDMATQKLTESDQALKSRLELLSINIDELAPGLEGYRDIIQKKIYNV